MRNCLLWIKNGVSQFPLWREFMDEILIEFVQYLIQHDEINSILLGGSRSKGSATMYSDYDLFILIKNEHFNSLRNEFSQFLERCLLIDIATFYSYVENWGYIYKTIGSYNERTVLFDISILPVSRVEEMSLRLTNIILLDRDGIAGKIIDQNKNYNFDTSYLEPMRRLDYVKLFGFEYLRLTKSLKTCDYWLAEKSIERMKTYYLHYRRIQESNFARNPHCPEKGFSIDLPNDSLQRIFSVSGNLNSLAIVAEQLFQLFYEQVVEKNILDRFILELSINSNSSDPQI